MNKFQTCQGCPDRSLTCRAECAGWKHREARKRERYAAKAIACGGRYESAHMMKLIALRDRESMRR